MPEPITVLGIGNPIMSDDGVGLEILEQLRAHYTDQQHLEFVDGGTSGMELLPTIQDAESLLVLDALAPTAHSNPGDVVTLIGDQIPRLLNSKLSPHQVGLLDLLSAARLLGTEPRRVAVVGGGGRVDGTSCWADPHRHTCPVKCRGGSPNTAG